MISRMERAGGMWVPKIAKFVARNRLTQPPVYRQFQTSPFVPVATAAPTTNHVLQFIKKNTAIPNFIAKVAHDDINQIQLQQAIINGNDTANIFMHPDCSLYLIYLLKNEKIPFWSGITTYVYLMSLMQFTPLQPLLYEHEKLKKIRGLSVEKLAINNQITFVGQKYLTALITNLAKQQYHLDPHALEIFVKTLQGVEQWLVMIDLFSNTWFDDYKDLTSILISNTPFVARLEHLGREVYCVPSSTMINYILTKITDQPMQMMPIFGAINEDTLAELHAQNFHPMAIYSPFVKSNIVSVHYRSCGPFTIWLHDLGHMYWANMLTRKEREVIVTRFIPEVKTLIAAANLISSDFKNPVIVSLNKVIQAAVDYDLTDIHGYIHSDNRLAEYLAKKFGSVADHLYPKMLNHKEKIGGIKEDYIYLLIQQRYYHPDLSVADKKLWFEILLKINEKTGGLYRDEAIINALINIAKKTVGVKPVLMEKTTKINWQFLLDLFTHTDHEYFLWQQIKNAYHDEYLALINQHNIIFFPPLLKFTQEDRQQFCEYFKKQIVREEKKLEYNSQQFYKAKPADVLLIEQAAPVLSLKS
jgi:hypothetical protein